MSLGIVEIIALLLGMAGFGVAPNPNAPSADQALAYAMPDADVAVYVDAASLIPGNFKLLSQLADQPGIKSSPELAKHAREVVTQIKGARAAAQAATGIDVVSDVTDATAFIQYVANAEPRVVISVRGKFTPDHLVKIGKLTGRDPAKVGAGTMLDASGREPAVALTRDGVLLIGIGAPALLRERLADTWKAPSHAAGTALAHAAEALDARPVAAVVLTLSRAARAAALQSAPAPGFASDVISRHKAASFALLHDGLSFTWLDSTAAGLDAMELVARGVLDVLRAAQIAPRGLAQIAMGAIDSYRGAAPQLDALIKHKAELMRIVETYTGDGNFKVAIDKNPKALRLSVRATGKSISEVLPFGLVLPTAAVAWFGMAAPPPPPAMIAEPPAERAPAAKPPASKSPATKPPATKRP